MGKREYIGGITTLVLIAILLVLWGIAIHRNIREIKQATVNGVSINYLVKGKANGKPVLLIHGNGGSHKDLSVIIDQLAQNGYLVWAPDSRGQGDNPPLTEYHYADMAEDMHCFVEQVIVPYYHYTAASGTPFYSKAARYASSVISGNRLATYMPGPVKPAVFGWSDGGIIALMTEVKYPGTWSAIVTSGANIFPDCGIWNLEEERIHPADTSALYRMMLYEPDMTAEDMQTIQCPSLIVAGEHDAIPLEHTHLIGDNIPNGEIMIVPGADHGSHIMHSPKMGRIILEYFKQINY